MARVFAPVVPPSDPRLCEPWLNKELRRIGMALQQGQRGLAAIARGEMPDASGTPLIDTNDFFRLSGRFGGQIANFDRSAGGSGYLSSTSSPIKGFIYFGYSTIKAAFDETNALFGVNVSAPAARFHARHTTGGGTTEVTPKTTGSDFSQGGFGALPASGFPSQLLTNDGDISFIQSTGLSQCYFKMDPITTPSGTDTVSIHLWTKRNVGGSFGGLDLYVSSGGPPSFGGASDLIFVDEFVPSSAPGDGLYYHYTYTLTPTDIAAITASSGGWGNTFFGLRQPSGTAFVNTTQAYWEVPGAFNTTPLHRFELTTLTLTNDINYASNGGGSADLALSGSPAFMVTAGGGTSGLRLLTSSTNARVEAGTSAGANMNLVLSGNRASQGTLLTVDYVSMLLKGTLQLEDTGAGTNAITLKAPTTPTVHTLTLPATPIADGFLQMDAAATGALAWVPLSSLSSAEFKDSAFRIIGSGDATKKLAFEVDGTIPTATTYTLTAPRGSGTIAILEADNLTVPEDWGQLFTGMQTFLAEGGLRIANESNPYSGRRFSVADNGASAVSDTTYTLPEYSGTLLLADTSIDQEFGVGFLLIRPDNPAGIRIVNTTANSSEVGFFYDDIDNTGVDWSLVRLDILGTDYDIKYGADEAGDVILRAGTMAALDRDQTFTGINIFTGTFKYDIASASTGYVLTSSDNDGTAVWSSFGSLTTAEFMDSAFRVVDNGDATKKFGFEVAAITAGTTRLWTIGDYNITWPTTAITQGDLWYGSAANTLVALAKDTNATRYLSNTGTTNNPAWAQINLANGVTGDLPFANLTQIVGLSVLGTATTATADVAAITAGTDNQVLRRSGTALAFGAINLASSDAVTGLLAFANGGTNANLTASNGGIVYSTASAFAILAGTATAGQILRSGASSAPTWSTATYPATAGTVGNFLVSDGTNWVSTAGGGLTTAEFTDSAFRIIGSVTASKKLAFEVDGFTAATTRTWTPGDYDLTWPTAQIVQGDLLYGSAAGVLERLPKDTNSVRYLCNAGTFNNPLWAQVDLTFGVQGRLGLALIEQINKGVLGNITGALADVQLISGSNGTILRNAGLGLGFGSIDLSLSAAVGTSILGVANGGTGRASPTSGNLLVGAGASVMTLLAPGADGGVVYSDGTTWSRAEIVTDGDGNVVVDGDGNVVFSV